MNQGHIGGGRYKGGFLQTQGRGRMEFVPEKFSDKKDAERERKRWVSEGSEGLLYRPELKIL